MSNPRTLFVLIVVLAIGALWQAYQPTSPTVRSPSDAITGSARVIDGDSIEIGTERVRLFGIDAPEGRQECHDAAGTGYACGREAARALRDLIGGRTVTCREVDHDQHDRDVAICSVENRDLGEEMVRAGHALDYPRHSRGRYAAAEREARAAKRGIWRGAFERPAQWRQQHPR